MDGSLLAFLATHPAASTFALLLAAAIGAALYRHSAACKETRREIREAMRENTAAVNRLSERVSALEATNNATHMREIAALVATARETGDPA